MGNAFFQAVEAVLSFDNEPNNHGDHLGSAYQDGWWGYVSKDLRRLLGQPVSDGFSRTYCGGGSLTACRDALRQALSDALAVPATTLYDEDADAAGVQRVDTCPAGKSDQWCFDSVRFRPIGAVTVRTIHWINRPTFQQAVEVQGHRARGHVRPKSATRLRLSLVPAYKGCSAPNRQHGPPLAFGSCNPPQTRSDYLTLGAPDVNGQVANSTGQVIFSVLPGDVNIGLSITDVRKQSDLSDYTGQLQIDSLIRITDRDNDEATGGGSDSATVTDFPVNVPVTCAATLDTTVGGACSTATTLDAVLPGMVKEGDRSSWEVGAVQVFDGGADGLLSTTPNTLFARQGVFVP
jgi:hypothetical protein